MILAIEPTWTGAIHVSNNVILLNIAEMAFPGQEMRVFADSQHLKEMQALLRPGAHVQFKPIELSPTFRHRPHIVSAGRLFTEIQFIRRALAQVPASEDCLLILLSATSTALAAAARLAAMRRGRTFVQAMLHGNLNELTGWRHRDPLRRALDLKSVLGRDYGGRLRYLVLEEFIRTKLAELSPVAARATDVLPHPLALEGHDEAESRLELPLRVGLVGLGSVEKGMGTFLKIAKQLKPELGDKICFHHVGTFAPGTDPSLYGLLEEPPSTGQLPRAEFLARIARLHYFVFPYTRNYYGLSASGAFLDAVAALKPVIATRIPLTEQMFREFGAIGYLCEDENEIVSTLRGIVQNPDATLYQAQVERLKTTRLQRLPDALVPRYREIVTKALPGFAAREPRTAAFHA